MFIYLQRRELIFVVKEPLFKKPFGGSKYPYNNRHMGSCYAYCEICGTTSKADSDTETFALDNFLGLQIVEECCGGLLDLIYEEFGEEFAIRFLKEFLKDPLNPRFAIFSIVMNEGFTKMGKKVAELQKKTKENQATLSLLKKA
jgi:hypothetical protein